MTYHFELNNKASKQGKYVIFLRITENRKIKRILTSIELSSPRDWNKISETVRRSEPHALIWNQVLADLKEEAKSITRELTDEFGAPTLEEVALRLRRKETKATLLAFMSEIMESQAVHARWGSRGKYGDTCHKLQAFLKTKGLQDIPLRNVDLTFVEQFEEFLLTLPNRKDTSHTRTLHPNTIAKHKKTLKAVLNKAILMGLLKPGSIPQNLSRIRECDSSATGLEDQELARLLQLDLEPDTSLWHVRNLFFLSIYCCGARLGDVMQFRWCNCKGGRLQYQMRKVGKPIDILLVPEALAILDLYRKEPVRDNDYIFPYLDSTAPYAQFITLEDKQMMPNALSKELYHAINVKQVDIGVKIKKLAELAGVPPFTFHAARHTFAMKANSAGTDNYLLKEMMNHSSLSVTQIYMQRHDHHREDEALQKIFSTPAPAGTGSSTGRKMTQARKLIGQLTRLGLDSETIRGLLEDS